MRYKRGNVISTFRYVRCYHLKWKKTRTFRTVINIEFRFGKRKLKQDQELSIFSFVRSQFAENLHKLRNYVKLLSLRRIINSAFR